MTFLLSSQNIFEYLTNHRLCIQQDQELSKIELKTAKNFNLLINLPNNRKLLVKQERHNQEGKAAGEFLNEWRVQEFWQHFSELRDLGLLLPKVLHFDKENSIIVFNYLNDYRDLAGFYAKENVFPIEIATFIGTVIATIHRTTWVCQEYREFFQSQAEKLVDQAPDFTYGLERISPEVFGVFPVDGLKFFALYQRYDSLGQAIADLSSAFNPCCLIHNDLKLNNILLHDGWEQSSLESEPKHSIHNTIRLIDWERSGWGDPALDLGTIIASYLQIWLSSLVVSQSIDIQEALRLAMTPLEKLQPSITALTKAYLNSFPEILEHRPDFLRRTMQFSGLALIQQIQAMIQYQKSFDNTGICMLQVAKSLLCHPEQSVLTVFGTAESELTKPNLSHA